MNQRLGRADYGIKAALRKLCLDKSLSLRFALAERLLLLEKPAPTFMWEIVDIFVSHEKKFAVLDALLSSLDNLWADAPDKVRQTLCIIAKRAMRSAPAENHIYETLARTNLFRFLRTGDSECEAFIAGLITECDSQRASHALGMQLHNCRRGGWLTAGDAVKTDTQSGSSPSHSVINYNNSSIS
jgi:hypothetical protein